MSVRLLALAGIQLGADAILQRVRKMMAQRLSCKVRVLGVDDFTFRKGQRYGTILIDHERHRVVDLLPSREATDLADWLRTHPEVEIITRDRAPAYIEGATSGAPHAQQSADRWHLLHNLTEAYKTLLQHQAQEVRETVKQLNGSAPTQLPPPTVPLPQIVPPTASEYMRSRSDQQRRQAFHAERKACYEQVKQLQAAGLTIIQIAHQLGKSYGGVKTFYEAHDYPVWNCGSPGSQVAPYAAYLQQRWAEGCQNAQQLYREIQVQGYAASALTVRRYLMPWRQGQTTTPVASPYARMRLASPRWAAPSASECLWLLLKGETALTAEQLQFRQVLLERSTPIRQGRELVREFQQLLSQRNLAAFAVWQVRAQESKLKEFAGFLSGLQKDVVAVQNAITQEWSNGATEGHVNRLKNIKRSMFGRAKFDLLKARVING